MEANNMADKVSATISYVDANNRKGMKAVTDINPNADNGAVKNFCSGLNALTTNTLTGIEKIERTDITNATAKPKLTLTLSSTARNGIYITDQFTCDILFVETNLPNFTYEVEARISVTDKFNASLIKSDDRIYFASTTDSTPLESGTYTMKIYFEETETTAATTAQLVISGDAAPVFTIL